MAMCVDTCVCVCVLAHSALWGLSVCECSQAAPVQVTGSCYFDVEDLVAATVHCVCVSVTERECSVRNHK